jgi:hypothetical protein
VHTALEGPERHLRSYENSTWDGLEQDTVAASNVRCIGITTEEMWICGYVIIAQELILSCTPVLERE